MNLQSEEEKKQISSNGVTKPSYEIYKELNEYGKKKKWILEILTPLLWNDAAKIIYLYTEDSFSFESRDGIVLNVPKKWALISSVVQKNVEDNVYLLQVDCDSDVLLLFIDYVVHHKGAEGPIPSKPLKSKDLAACGVDRWDVDFLNSLYKDLCCKHLLFKLMSVANTLNINGLVHLCGAQIAACIKGIPLEMIKPTLASCDKNNHRRK